MASLLIGSDKLIEIRTAYVDVVVKTKGRQPQCTWKIDTGTSSLKVMAMDLKQVSVPVQDVAERYTDHKGIAFHEYCISPIFFEQTDYVVTIRSKNQEELSFQSNSTLIDDRVNRVIDEDPTLLSGVINFGNSVGYSDLIIKANGRTVLSVTLEVYPSKISYKEDYREMMADINNMVSESILDFMRKTYQGLVPNHKRNDVPAVFFTILQAIYHKYLQAINRIISIPHHKLVTEHEVTPHYKATRIDTKSIRWLMKHLL